MEVEESGGGGVKSCVLLKPTSQVEAAVDVVVREEEDCNENEDNVMKDSRIIPGEDGCEVDENKRKSFIVRIPKSGTGGGKRPITLYSHPYNAPAQSSPTKIISGLGAGRNNRRRSVPPNPSTPISSSLPTLASRGSTGEDWLIGGGGSGGQKNSRKMRRYQKKLSKRLRRVTQAAPNNNNEFLMQEHDHLYHLDDEDSNSDEQLAGDGQHAVRQHRYSSSPEEDEEDFLARDFSNTYDVVHAERLFSMSKNQLIHEYQLMEERVEFLENKLRSALLERGRCGVEDDGNEDDDAEMFPVARDDCSTTSTGSKSGSIPVPNSTTHNGGGGGHSDSNHCNLSDSDLLISSSSSSYSGNNYASPHLSSSQSSGLPEDQDNVHEDSSEDI